MYQRERRICVECEFCEKVEGEDPHKCSPPDHFDNVTGEQLYPSCRELRAPVEYPAPWTSEWCGPKGRKWTEWSDLKHYMNSSCKRWGRRQDVKVYR